MKGLVTIVAAAGFTLSACGWISPEKLPTGVDPTAAASLPAQPTPPVTTDPALAEKLPDDIRATGVIEYLTDATYAPMQFTVADNLTIVGADVDLGNAVAARLGVRSQWSSTAFEVLLDDVVDGQADAAMSALTITPEREQKVVMVSYLQAGTAWAARSGDPTNPEDACGKTVAVQRFTVQATDLEQRSVECTDSGRPPITVALFTAASAVVDAVLEKKADAMIADSPVVAYEVERSDGMLEQIGETYDEAPYGIAVADRQLATSIQRALQTLIDGGSYEQILQRWGLEDAAVDQALINPVR